jgi:hypothetical protein
MNKGNLKREIAHPRRKERYLPSVTKIKISPFVSKKRSPIIKSEIGDLPFWMSDLPYIDLRREISLFG